MSRAAVRDRRGDPGGEGLRRRGYMFIVICVDIVIVRYTYLLIYVCICIYIYITLLTDFIT